MKDKIITALINMAVMLLGAAIIIGAIYYLPDDAEYCEARGYVLQSIGE